MEKKKEGLVKQDPIAAILPLMRDIMPAPVPQISYKGGLITNFFHNWKLEQIETSTEIEANIMESKERTVRAQLSIIEQVTAFSAKLDNTFKRIQADNDQIETMKKLQQGQVEKQQLENQLLFYQVKNEEMDFKMKEKNFAELCGKGDTNGTPKT